MATDGNNNDANSLGNPFTAAGISGSTLSDGSFPSAYDYAKRFVNAKNVNGSGNNGVTALDDPTYLGFGLMFDITSPLFNGATNGDPGINDGGSSNEYPTTPSAIGYLNKIGEANRVQYLRAFVQGILEIQRTRPYYFQTITGLLEAFQKSTQFSQDPYTGTTGEEGIAIGCLEAIDLKITALFNLYRMAIYDVRYKRFVLPKNLMRFDVYVNVHEIRKFRTVVKSAEATNTRSAETTTADHVNENTSQIRFKFTDCIFNVAASGKAFEGVTNTGGNITTTEIKWGYSVLELVSQYSGFDSALEEDKKQTVSSPAMEGKQKSFLKDKLDSVVQKAEDIGASALANLEAAPGNLLAAAQARVGGIIDSAVLGNVFGLQNQIIGALTNPGILNAALGAALQSSSGPDKSIASNLGDSAFDPALPRKSSLSGTSSAFDNTAPVNDRLNGYNAFGAPGPTQDNGGLSSTNIFN
tara:strand:+ start:287 stop:1693 length:1407 start_codon:yes stop_codon:yes gene_type:complete